MPSRALPSGRHCSPPTRSILHPAPEMGRSATAKTIGPAAVRTSPKRPTQTARRGRGSWRAKNARDDDLRLTHVGGYPSPSSCWSRRHILTPERLARRAETTTRWSVPTCRSRFATLTGACRSRSEDRTVAEARPAPSFRAYGIRPCSGDRSRGSLKAPHGSPSPGRGAGRR